MLTRDKEKAERARLSAVLPRNGVTLERVDLWVRQFQGKNVTGMADIMLLYRDIYDRVCAHWSVDEIDAWVNAPRQWTPGVILALESMRPPKRRE
jgi:hypothetical protein